MEWFSRSLNAAVRDNFIHPFHAGPNLPIINHLLFADDMLIFTNGSKDSLKNLLSLIDEFCLLSGEQLNPSKSKMFFSKRINDQRQSSILELTGFDRGTFPVMYLGAPLFYGRAKLDYFQCLENKIKSRIEGWMRNLLTMGGRLTLINSVLHSVGIHCMTALPIPKGTLKRIRKMVASFLWDQGALRRKHWISWDRICRPKDRGGLGIRLIDDIMLAVRGKMAWRFITVSSLWSRYMKARSNRVCSASPAWAHTHRIVEALREQSAWVIGRGDISVKDFCVGLGLQLPIRLANISIKQILEDQELTRNLIHLLPIRLQNIYNTVYLSEQKDRLAWTVTSSGDFTTKAFWLSFQTRHPKLSWGSLIWQKWIPSKISCFTWRLILNGLGTDDRVQQVGVHLASKCLCCENPKSESSRHLFFESELSSRGWGLLSFIFNIPAPHSINSFIQSWIGKDQPKTYLDCLRVGLACCTLWEIWKTRNKSKHNKFCVDIRKNIFQWAQDMNGLIHKPHESSFVDDLALKTLFIKQPPDRKGVKGRWIRWLPCPTGVTMNIAVVFALGKYRAAAIFRDSQGDFKLAYVMEVRSDTNFLDLAVFIGIAGDRGNSHGLQIMQIQSSHPMLRWLVEEENYLIPWNAMHIKNALQSRFGKIFRRICSMINGSALALAYIRAEDGVVEHVTDLPLHVRRSLREEQTHLRVFCAWKCCSINASPIERRQRILIDDSILTDTNNTRPRTIIQDDINI